MVVDGGNKRARKTPVAAVRAFLDYSISLEIEVDALTFCCLLLSTESLLSTATSTSSTLPLPSSESSPPSPLRLASSKPAKQQQQRPQASGEAGSPPQMNGNMVGGKPVMRRRVTNGSNATIVRQHPSLSQTSGEHQADLSDLFYSSLGYSIVNLSSPRSTSPLQPTPNRSTPLRPPPSAPPLR
jgi:hypothetical protein